MRYQHSLQIHERIEVVLQLIKTGRYSTPALAEKVGGLIPTISRIVAALRERGHTWWGPTIEEVLKAWSREPTSLVLIDKKVRHYLKLYQEQTHSDQTPEDRRVVDEFHKTWNVLRRELVPGAK